MMIEGKDNIEAVNLLTEAQLKIAELEQELAESKAEIVKLDDMGAVIDDQHEKEIDTLKEQIKTIRNDTLEQAAEIAAAATVNCRHTVCEAGEAITEAIRKEIDK